MIFRRLTLFLGSRLFFWIVLGVLVLSSTWVALTSLYPMAFDEEVHFGMIQIYAQHLNPFSVVQTPAANDFGSIVTDPSYLYYYLMSFPYRLLSLFTDSQTVIVVVLRMLNVALFAASLVLFRRLLRTMGVSSALTHSVLAVFVLIPVVPLLAGQINYDNVLMILVPLLALVVLRIRQDVQVRGRLSLLPLVSFLLICLLGSIVKYAFLPIAAGAGLYLIVLLLRAPRPHTKLWLDIPHQFRSLHKLAIVGLALALLVAVVGFSQRYVTNLVQYGAPVPDCAAVLTVEECKQWGPWGRDYDFARNTDGHEVHSPLVYTFQDWLPGLWQRLFFTLSGPTSDYQTELPLPVPSMTFAVLAIVGAVLVLIFGWRILKDHPAFALILTMAVLYIAALWVQVYGAHVETHRPVAINGRYLLPFLPLLGAFVALAYGRLFSRLKVAQFKSVFVVVVIVLFLQGGGILTYLALADKPWFTPGWPAEVNMAIQEVIKPLLIGTAGR